MQSTDQLSGTTTGEFSPDHPDYRWRTAENPAESPTERIRRELRAEFEARLRDACSHWPTGEFDRVVADVAETALKFHGQEKPQKSER